MSRPQVRIVCDHGHGRPTIVATMVRDRDGHWQDWGGPQYVDGVLTFHGRRATTGLIGDRVPVDNVNDPDREEPQRYVHDLRCTRCGEHASVRAERMDAGLERARTAGVEVIPLRALT